MIKQEAHQIKGMQRDLTVSKFNPEFAYSAQNIRITARENNTLLSITNEKGNIQVLLKNSEGADVIIEGSVIGYNVLNSYLTLFSTDNVISWIYRLEDKGEYFEVVELFSGDLGFSTDFPIETLGVYENENIQKVYWVDGKNQPRVINIVNTDKIGKWVATSFDFVQELELNETIDVERNDTSSGSFASGVIQYAFTYYNLYGQESNIFYTTSLQYISFSNRGASPEDTVSCSFTITIENPDTRFDYLRIYSIHRTSIDATPTVTNVVDLSIDNSEELTYVDNGTTGVSVDPTELLYIGGESIVPKSMVQKDDTLFLGNILLNRNVVSEGIRAKLSQNPHVSYTTKWIQYYTPFGSYPYQNQLSKYRIGSGDIRGFHSNEWYRFGIQFQHKTGKWSEPVFLCDKKNGPEDSSDHTNTVYPTMWTTFNRSISTPIALTTISKEIADLAIADGYIRARGVVVYPLPTDREVVCQGILCPTVFNLEDRYKNAPFAQSSWFSRPNLQFDIWDSIEAQYYYLFTITSSTSGLEEGAYYTVQGTGFATYVYDGMQDGKYRFHKLGNFIDEFTSGTLVKNSGNGPDTLTYSNKEEHALIGFGDLFGTEVASENSKAGVISLDNRRVWWEDNSGTRHERYFDFINKGVWAEFRHNYPIPNNWERNAEIQCIANAPTVMGNFNTSTQDSEITSWIANHKEYFYVDQSIVTLHSPEIEFDDNVKNTDTSSLKLRIVGKISMTGTLCDTDIQTSTPPYNINMPGVYTERIGTTNLDIMGVKSLISNPMYFDFPYDQFHWGIGFMVYPWHRNGSLNNQGALDSDDTGSRTAMLYQKKLSNLKFSVYTKYLNSPWYAEVEGDANHNGISGVTIFDSNEQSLVRIPGPSGSSIGDINYYGNIDKVVVPTRIDEEYNFTYSVASSLYGVTSPTIIYEGKTARYYFDPNIKGNRMRGYPIVGTPITTTFDGEITDIIHNSFNSIAVPISALGIQGGTSTMGDDGTYGLDPVSIKYKSTPHAVLALNYTDDSRQLILPTIYDAQTNQPINHISGIFDILPWDRNCKGIYQDSLNVETYSYADKESTYFYGFLWLAELYNDSVENRFGGTTEEAFSNNIWLPAGEPVSIADKNDQGKYIGKDTVIKYTDGDTFFQRYDCLKTYPYTLEDQNSITEIVSFLCETRVNIDGRYDRNRGQVNNLTMTPENFNLINNIYTQKNNFFNYRGLNYNLYSLNYFPNTITWTKEKQAGAIIDTWTSITMVSTLDLDGDKGEVVSLNAFNNEIYCFQKQGFSNILFNNRVQIPTSDGMPIEITNGLKVDGKRYISNSIGCNNKWSITETPSGLYFIDNATNSIYLFNGQISSLSDRLGFRQWIGNYNNLESWIPSDKFINFITYYDKNNNDIYFINGDTALVYSELLGQFTSFMSYENTPYMFNINDKFYAIKNNMLWKQFAGNYNIIYNEYKPYSITVISNSDEPYDKIYNNLDWRADCWNDTTLLVDSAFDTLEVWNEYQKGVSTLTKLAAKPSPLKKKFRVWRANIPRANTDWNGVKANNRDRIRNTWAYIKLAMNKENTNRMEFHDMIVHYFV